VTARAPETQTLFALYHTMLMARAIERRLWVLNRLEGVDASFRGTGFEAVQGAAAAALRPGFDWVVPCPLDLTLCLAIGMSPLDVMLAVFGRAADPSSAGRQAPGTFGSKAPRIVTTSAAAGRHIVQAAGIAYASKVSGRDEVTLVCTDLRGTYAGDWHEGINFAGAHALPLICLVEDHAAGSRPIPRHTDAPVAQAEGYGLAAEAVDGGDFGASLAAFSRAVDRARSKGGPTLIHAQVVELSSTAAGGGMLPPEQLEALARQDPIDRLRRRLRAAGVLDDSTDDQAQRDCALFVEAAVAEARLSPSPEGPLALDNVFSREERRG
jgi:2-oxoisovalerate dehydrogenase E1 component alpha subunit